MVFKWISEVFGRFQEGPEGGGLSPAVGFSPPKESRFHLGGGICGDVRKVRGHAPTANQQERHMREAR